MYGARPGHAGGQFLQQGDLRTVPPSNETVMVVSSSLEQSSLPLSMDSGGFVLGQGLPQSRPLWKKGWRTDKVTCTASKLPVQSTGQSTPSSESTVMDFPRDRHGSNLPLHCIDLSAHSSQLNELLSTVHTGLSATLPPPPTRHCHPLSLSGWRGPTSPGNSELPLVTLEQASLHKLLRKSSAAVCATIGYHKASSQALDTLSSVMADFIANLTQRMAANLVQSSENGQVFDDVLDQSLTECGLGGKAGLATFWKDSVIGLLGSLQGGIDKSTQEFIHLTDPPRPRVDHEAQDLHPPLADAPIPGDQFELSLDDLPAPGDLGSAESSLEADEPPGVFPPEVFEGVPDMGLIEPSAKRLRMISFGE